MKMREEGYFIAKEFRARGARRSYSSFVLFAFDGNARARARNGRKISPETAVKYSRLSVSENVRTWNAMYSAKQTRLLCSARTEEDTLHGIYKSRNVINEARDSVCLLCHFFKR